MGPYLPGKGPIMAYFHTTSSVNSPLKWQADVATWLSDTVAVVHLHGAGELGDGVTVNGLTADEADSLVSELQAATKRCRELQREIDARRATDVWASESAALRAELEAGDDDPPAPAGPRSDAAGTL